MIVKSLVSFRHGVSPWWGVTVQRESVIDKIMFATQETAEKWLKAAGCKRPRGGWSWIKSDFDLYNRYGKN